MKVFLDTNVLISSVATRGLCADVFREVIANHQLIVSPSLLSEVEKVLENKIGAPQDLITSFIDLIRQDNIISDSGDLLDINIQDKTDIPILSSAFHGGAECFITGDKKILALVQIESMEILSLRMFWEKLVAGRSNPDIS